MIVLRFQYVTDKNRYALRKNIVNLFIKPRGETPRG